jgi:RNA polymerase sigma factor (TIGR02999 family)
MGDPPSEPEEATTLMHAAAAGDRQAADQLLPLVYEQLRRTAKKAMDGERPGHTLQATALVHEAYAKLVGGGAIEWRSRAHFYEAAARAMRQILVDHARARQAQKRGGGRLRVPLAELSASLDADPRQTLALHEALSRLESEDAQLGTVVRLRFYAGLSGDETAAAMGVSPRTVDSLWAHARAWLYRELARGAEE